MHLRAAPHTDIKHFPAPARHDVRWRDAEWCRLEWHASPKIMGGGFQLRWHISPRKVKGCLLEKHISWQSAEGCEQWDLTNLQTTARHSDLRLLQKESLDKLVSVTLNMLNEWFLPLVLWWSIAFLPTCVWNAALYRMRLRGSLIFMIKLTELNYLDCLTCLLQIFKGLTFCSRHLLTLLLRVQWRDQHCCDVCAINMKVLPAAG